MVYLAADLTDVGRVLRQIEFLSEEYDLAVAGTGNSPPLPSGVEFLALSQRSAKFLSTRIASGLRVVFRRLGLYGTAYWCDVDTLRWRTEVRRGLPATAVIVNDLTGLPLACAIAGDAPVAFDAHEHYTSESASWTARQRLSMRGAHEWIVKRYVPRMAGMMTVSAGIAAAYEERNGERPVLVTNAPFFQALNPSPVGDPIRLLYIGIADERRRLEDTIDAVRALSDHFTLDLVLAGDNDYRRRLEALVGDERNIRVLPPVANSGLWRFANDYDIGISLLTPHFPNQRHVLLNKLFDYIQARLAVAIGPSPEMAAIVASWECGVVADTFDSESLAGSLRGLTTQTVHRMKVNADRAARTLTAENNREVVVGLVEAAIANTKATRAP